MTLHETVHAAFRQYYGVYLTTKRVLPIPVSQPCFDTVRSARIA